MKSRRPIASHFLWVSYLIAGMLEGMHSESEATASHHSTMTVPHGHPRRHPHTCPPHMDRTCHDTCMRRSAAGVQELWTDSKSVQAALAAGCVVLLMVAAMAVVLLVRQRKRHGRCCCSYSNTSFTALENSLQEDEDFV